MERTKTGEREENQDDGNTTRKLCPDQQKMGKFLLNCVLYEPFLQFFVDLAQVNKMVVEFLLI